jgi:hypothetical protein
VDVRVGRENRDSVTGTDAGLKEAICKVLYPLCPDRTRFRTERLGEVKVIPDRVRVEDRGVHIRMGKCKFVGVYLRRTQEKVERVLETGH